MRGKKTLAVVCVGLLSGCQGTSDSSPEQNASSSPRPAKAGAGAPTPRRPAPVVLPEGTTLHLVLETAVSSATSHQGDLVVARVHDDTLVGEKVVVPAGSEVKGRVVAAVPSGRVKGLARLAIDFDHLVLSGKDYPIEALAIDITAENTHKKDAAIVGGGAVGGALIGALAGGKKGAGIGALIGAGAGGGVVLTNKGKEVDIPSGSHFGVKLTREAQIG